MKAFRLHDYSGPGAWRLEDLPDPQPGPGQVLVRLRAASLNYRDLLIAKGLYSRSLRLPLIPASDAAGEVVEVGPGLTRWRVGDRVSPIFLQGWHAGRTTEAQAKTALGGAIDGVLCERAVFPEDGLVATPAHLSDEEAATLPCAAVTAWNALVSEGRLSAGETVLVQGTGGVALFALQLARIHGARVVITSSSDEKLARAKALGAHEGINYKTNPKWGDAARALGADGRGVDHVVELGGAGTLGQSMRAVRTGGIVSLIGVLAGGEQPLNITPILMKNLRIQGIFVGSRAMFEAMNRAIALHGLKPVVDRVFPFEEAPRALAYLESGAHFGKVVVRI